tara:strand:- start:159 stop:629 length:471 start_codon:yes stop_codon:yes gene_type:complete
MKRYIAAFLFVVVLVLVLLMTLSSSAKAQTMCIPKLALIEAMDNKYSEKETEYGIDGSSSSYVGIYVNAKTKSFTFTMTPKSNPSILCAIGTGTQWEQLPSVSRGVLSGGSLISIAFDEGTGDWQLMYFDKNKGVISVVTSGNSWERVIKINDSSI